MPLEIYIPKEKGKDIGGKRDESHIVDLSVKINRQDVKQSLESFRENYKQRRAEAIKIGRERGKREFLENENGLSDSMKKKEINAPEEYGRLWDFQDNYFDYHKSGGWKESYLNDLSPEDNLPIKNKISIEQYVYQRQVEKLANIRDGLMIDRINGHFVVLNPDLPEAETEQSQQKMLQDCRNYFTDNKDAVEQYFILKDEAKVPAKDKLQAAFFASVLPGVDLKKPELLKEAQLLFDELLSDYDEMLNSIGQLNLLNSKMVELMSEEGMTEEEWYKKMADEAEKKLNEMNEEDKKAEEQQTFQSTGEPVSFDFSNMLYTGDISATEKLAADTKISISMVRPGEYKIRFPGSEDTVMESSFMARQVLNDATGQMETVYFFKDPLLDIGVRVGEAQFKQMVNGVYLEHVMSDSVKAGADYIGPNLNDEVLPDKRMQKLAELLFYPKKLNERPLTTEQANVFRKLMLVLVSKSNNEKGTTDYGDLLAMGSRVGLLELALTMDSASKAKICYNYLMTSSVDQTRHISVEDLCHRIGVPKNSGNYQKV